MTDSSTAGNEQALVMTELMEQHRLTSECPLSCLEGSGASQGVRDDEAVLSGAVPSARDRGRCSRSVPAGVGWARSTGWVRAASNGSPSAWKSRRARKQPRARK